MQQMPLLRRSNRRPRRRLAVVLTLAVLAGGLVVAWRVLAARPEPSAPPPESVVTDPAPTPAAPPPAPPVEDPLQRAGMRYVRATVAGPLETAFVTAVGREVGAPLTQVVNRSLVWWVSIPEDLRKGDIVEVLFSEKPGAEPFVHAVRFRSEKAGRTFETFRFQPAGAAHPRFFTRDGEELELRLKDSPLDDYEQVTSLIRDGRGHKGVDFRIPVGTPVKATFDATVVRRNWNFRANGNCLELREVGGERRTAYFLHLSELAPEPRVGDHVKRGQVIARSGNTGRSFAPHLHYQLMTSGGTILDPFTSHDTVRRALGDGDRAAYAEEVKRLEGLLAVGAGAQR